MTIKKERGGYRAYSHKTGKAVGPVRTTRQEAVRDLSRARHIGKEPK